MAETLDQIFGVDWFRQRIAGLLKAPHTPTLTLLRKVEEEFYVVDVKGKEYINTVKTVQVKEVGEYQYAEEESFGPIRDLCKKQGNYLTDTEIDTKLLKTWYADLDFDAYTWGYGSGFNIDALTRIVGKLYKIKK
ncbi:hypothetical protein GOV14_05425 [Candidatus Pacearchaeota archaeon]|nr:hypothetical protein [Candidatus Pacearchaeota archaeon]